MQYAHAQDVLSLNVHMSVAAWILGAVQLVFIANFFGSLKFGRVAPENPWQATTLEWSAPTPPLAHGNFAVPPLVYRSAYEYSVPGAATDFLPQGDRSGS
jgi:cytochrome c oxidase subunit 1